MGVAGGRGLAGTPTALSGSSSSIGNNSDDADHTLTGNWELLWENFLHKCK